jgi:adenosine kinase
MVNNIYLFGSLAYDNIIDYNGIFSDLVDNDIKRSHNFSFLASKIVKEFGGCSGNIAYSLNLLEATSTIVSAVGLDGNDYLKWLSSNEIATDNINFYKDELTAQAHIIADKGNNQITSFYQGALSYKHNIDNLMIDTNDIAIVSPDNIENMKNYIYSFKKNHIKYIFDPGQVVGLFSKDELITFISCSYITIVNDYEFDILKTITEMSRDEIVKNCTLIVTQGKNGSILYDSQTITYITAYKPVRVLDSTGCGDSFRSGLLYGIKNNFDTVKSCKIGASLASFNIELHGTQNHKCTLLDIEKRIKLNDKTYS